MKNFTPRTRRALKAFDRYIKTNRLRVNIETAADDWTCRHSRIEDTLKQCQTDTVGIAHAFCPRLQLGTFVTFPANQGAATSDQILQALRLALIARCEAQL